MADACFVDYSALGAGLVDDYDNQLTEAPEEEGEFDVLNDETFGDFGGDDEFDWEEQHEKFAEVFDDRANDSGFNTAEKSYRLQEEFVEHNIRQLGIDDEDLQDDPAIVKARQIPRKPQNLDALFGPSSPPSLLDTEYLVSPTSKNIWGSPIVDSPQISRQGCNIQTLFDFAKSAARDSPVPTVHGPHSRAPPMVLPKAQTLEEIESSLIPKAKPKVLTAEELERQLRGETSQPQRNRTPPSVQPLMPNGHPSPGNFGVLASSVNATPSRPMPPRVTAGVSPGVASQVINGRISPLQGNLGTPVAPCTTPPYRLMGTPLNRQSPATPGRGLSQPIGIPRSAIRGPAPGTPGSPFDGQQTLFGSPQGPYSSPHNRMPPPGAFSDPGYHKNAHSERNNRFQSPQQRGFFHNNRDRNSSKNEYNREHRYHRPPYNIRHEEREGVHPYQRQPSKTEDEYEGIMTQKEKDWIVKIQLLQLQTDNPYLDDYYYTTYCMKKKAKEKKKDGEDDDDNPKLVIPAMAKVESKSYKPAHFEGSLGRLTTSSVHNPRQIIDLLAKSVSETAGSATTKTNVGKELRKSRQLLLDIEKGFNLLLMVDDIEKKILALPEESRQPLFEHRSYTVDLLFHYLLCDGNSKIFMQNMDVRKGRQLVARALPLLDKVQSVGIVSLICKNLQQLMKKEDSEDDLMNVYEPCARVIDTCNLATVVMFSEDIQQEESQSKSKPIAIAIQNKFGSSVVASLLHRGEQIYSTTSPVDMDSSLQNEWSQFVHDFAGILAVVPAESVVPPRTTYPDIAEHLERLLNKRLIAVVEDHLKLFTESADREES